MPVEFNSYQPVFYTSTSTTVPYYTINTTNTTTITWANVAIWRDIIQNDPIWNPQAPPPVPLPPEFGGAPVPTVSARDRAMELLLACLDEEQKRELEQLKRFTVTSKSGRQWRINARGYSGNVELIDKDGVIARYCAHPPGYLPDADAWLAQMLTLETEDTEFIRVANVHWRRPGIRLPVAA